MTRYGQDASLDAVSFPNSMAMELINEGRGLQSSIYSSTEPFVIAQSHRHVSRELAQQPMALKQAHGTCGRSFFLILYLSLTIFLDTDLHIKSS